MFDPNYKDFRIQPFSVSLRIWQREYIYELCRSRKAPFSVVLDQILTQYFTDNPITESRYSEWNSEGECADF